MIPHIDRSIPTQVENPAAQMGEDALFVTENDVEFIPNRSPIRRGG
jgi:hypothetical protein